MKEYFSLQYRMINRRFTDSGVEPPLAYVALAIGFIGLSFYLFHKTEFAQYIFVLSALALAGKFSEIRRTEFIKFCFGDKRWKKIRIAENLLIVFPFIIFLVIKLFFLSAIILFALAITLALMNFRASLNFTIPTPFSKQPFEFSTGFRNSFYLIAGAYTATIIAVVVGNFNLAIFSMMLVFAITLSYYTKPEHEYFVWSYSLNPRMFLIKKIKTATLFSSLLTLPIAIIIAIFFYQNIGVLLLFFLVGWAFLVCMIVSKYAAYPAELNIAQGFLIAISIWFPPLLIVLIPYFFFKSQNRLRSLLK
ncbi:MAG: hypothetical protein ABIP35_04070 [Ginsengibacter sp.]